MISIDKSNHLSDDRFTSTLTDFSLSLQSQNMHFIPATLKQIFAPKNSQLSDKNISLAANITALNFQREANTYLIDIHNSISDTQRLISDLNAMEAEFPASVSKKYSPYIERKSRTLPEQMEFQKNESIAHRAAVNGEVSN